MPKFLNFDPWPKVGASKLGIAEVDTLPLKVFPWAVAGDGRIVYINVDIQLPGNKGPHATPVPDRMDAASGRASYVLTPYTRELSMTRRRICQSKLALLALTRSMFTDPAVDRVTAGVKEYIRTAQNAPAVRAEVAACTAKYMYSKAGFGRLGQPDDTPKGADKDAELFRTAMSTLDSGGLASKLAIHDFMGRVVFNKFRGSEPQCAVFERTATDVRPARIFGTTTGPAPDTPQRIEQLRGRQERYPGKTVPTSTAPGLLQPEEAAAAQLPDLEQPRERGSDRWKPSETNTPQSTLQIEQRNLIFGAGPSGSTGTLLQAAKLFATLDEELLKQYTLAIVGYLVGGGMHSYHEVMQIANLVGVPYASGSYLRSLPKTFTDSQEFAAWRDEFFDIVMLGARLWVLAPGAQPVQRLEDSANATQFSAARKAIEDMLQKRANTL